MNSRIKDFEKKVARHLERMEQNFLNYSQTAKPRGRRDKGCKFKSLREQFRI
jgi:hypothetical protein